VTYRQRYVIHYAQRSTLIIKIKIKKPTKFAGFLMICNVKFS